MGGHETVPLFNFFERRVRVLPEFTEVLDEVRLGYLFEHQLPHVVRCDVAKHPENLLDVPLLLAPLFVSLERLFENILGQLVHHVPDSHGFVVLDLYGHSQFNPFYVVHEPVDDQDGALFRIHVVGPLAEEVHKVVHGGQSAAGNVPGLSGRGSVVQGPLKVVVVGVVYPAPFYAQCEPIKRRVTVGTPHLIAAANLENHGPARGARLGVLVEELDRLHVVGVAHVLIALLFLVALFANVLFAEGAVPLGREKPLAVFGGALAHKLALLLIEGRPVPQVILAALEGHHGPLGPGDLESGLYDDCVEGPDGLDALDRGERPGHEALFALKEDGLSVGLEGTVSKGGRAGVVDDVSGPELVAAHAMGIGAYTEQKLLDTTATRVEITKGTPDPFAIRNIELLATD